MYNIQYFKEKFSTIPSEKWWVLSLNGYGGSHCALGHCGVREGGRSCQYVLTEEANSLIDIFERVLKGRIFRKISGAHRFNFVTIVNDGFIEEVKEYGTTPKERILRILDIAEELEQQEANLEFARNMEQIEYV